MSQMILFIFHLSQLSFSLQKSICIDDNDGETCAKFNTETQSSYSIYSKTQINQIFNGNPSELNLAIFTELETYIEIPKSYIINNIKIISNEQVIQLIIDDNSMKFNNLTIENTTIQIRTSDSNRALLDISDTIICKNSFLKTNTQHFRLKLTSTCHFNIIQNFDEIEIDENLTKFELPISNSIQFSSNKSINILSQNEKLLLILLSTTRQILHIESNQYSIQSNDSLPFYSIQTKLPIDFQQITSNDLDIYLTQIDYLCQSSIQTLFNTNQSPHITIEVYSGNVSLHSQYEKSPSFYDRTKCESLLTNLIFHNDSTCKINSGTSIPISIFSHQNLLIELEQQNTTILGSLFIQNGNVTIKGNGDKLFGCLSLLSISDYYHNSYLLSHIDLTEAEFFEQMTHFDVSSSFLILDDKITFHPTFLINAESIIGGKTISSFYIDKYTSVDFEPKTELNILDNGTLVIPFHLNFNETYEAAMEIHHKRYNELVDLGLNRTFDFDNFYDSFKYYYLKYMPVFPNFSRAFNNSYNQFYPHKVRLYKPNSQARIFIQRNDSPINSFYRHDLSIQCNISANSVELSSSLVSDYFLLKDFKMKGEFINDDCIHYKLNEIPTSAAELFVYAINNDIISALRNVPFISILTPMNIDTINTLTRNKKSRNVIVIVLESMKEMLNFTQFEKDANIFIVGLSMKDMNEFITFWNTIRKGNNPKIDLQKALKRISPKLPSILPTVRISMRNDQSLFAIGVTIHRSTIICGSITFALCHFTGYAFVSSGNLMTDLYSLSNLLNITHHYRFLNVTLIPNYISSLNNQTTDLLTITQIDFDENGWFFYSKGTIYDDITSSYTFGLPYILAESNFSVYSITDQIEYNLIQMKIPPKPINFISGKKLVKLIDSERIPLLSTEPSPDIIEIPQQTRLSFSGFWDNLNQYTDHFSFEFGNSDALIEKIPSYLNLSISCNKDISIDCNNINRTIKQLRINGSSFITSENGQVIINHLDFISPLKSTVYSNTNNLIIHTVNCELHSRSELNNSIANNIIMNPNSKLNFSQSVFNKNSNLKFNFNFDYELPLLIIHEYSNIESIVISYDRNQHSPYNPSFIQNLNHSKPFLIVNNATCSTLESSLLNEKHIKFESDFIDFLSNQFLQIHCGQIESDSYIYLTLTSIPQLTLIETAKDNDSSEKDPFSAPSLHIPTPSQTPKDSDMTAAIAGGTVGGLAFLGLAAFVIYFIVSSKKRDDLLLNTEDNSINLETKPTENVQISL